MAASGGSPASWKLSADVGSLWGVVWLKQKGFNMETATLMEINELSLQVAAELHLLMGKERMPKVRESALTA